MSPDKVSISKASVAEASASTSALGKSVAHDSAKAHVTGAAEYVDDMPVTHGQLHVAIGGSEIAHGSIEHINLDDVWQSAGVVDVMIASDLPALKDIGPVFPGDPLLLERDIEFVGQAIFAVAATSHHLARQAVAKAKIKYKPIPPVLSLKRAKDDAFFVRPPHRMQRGQADAALHKAKHRLQGSIEIGGQDHFYLEGQVALAKPTENGGITLYSSNQNPTEAQHLIAGVLGIAMHQVTVITRRMGGAFGGKETQAAGCCAFAALFARRNNCAVSCRLSRGDDMRMTGKRHPFLNQYDVGFDDDGVIVGIKQTLTAQCGNSPDLSDAIVDRAMFHCDNAYYFPHVEIDGLRCKSHTVSNTAFRGFGGPQGMMAIEAVMDDIASALQLDPLLVRQRNLYGKGERNITPYHQVVSTFTVPEIFEQLTESADYHRRKAAIDVFNRNSPVLKKGIAITPVKFGISFTVSHLNQGGALLHLYNDGSVLLNHGGTEMGQGLMVKVAQVVADTLGMSLGRVSVSATRTDKVPNTSATAASSGTDLNGMAALRAANKIKQRLLDFLCEKHGVNKEQIFFENDAVEVRLTHGTGKSFVDTKSAATTNTQTDTNNNAEEATKSNVQTYTWQALASEAYRARVQLSATGFYKTPSIHYDRSKAAGRPFLYYANGAAASEVIIDTLTGETRLLRTDIVHDVGRSINPAIDKGQIEGGYIQGVGWLTSEELKWDSEGYLLTDSPATYKIPAISDAPNIFNVALLKDSPNEEATVFRSKAVGEPPLMLAMSVFSAIRHAIAAVAEHKVFPRLNAPATPEEVLRVCDEVRSARPQEMRGKT